MDWTDARPGDSDGAATTTSGSPVAAHPGRADAERSGVALEAVDRRRFGRTALLAGGAAVGTGVLMTGLAPAAGATAVSYSTITPYRSIDTRNFPDPGAGLPAGWYLDVDVYSDESGATVIPQSIAAITYNLTAASTVGSGYLSVYPSNAGFPGVSSINWWQSGLNIANGGTVACGFSTTIGTAGCVRVLCGAGQTHFIIDVTGYYA